jgi:3-oxoacyl-[acyl-carrier-protein] synthase-3
MGQTCIVSIGSALPSRIIDNTHFSSYLDTSDEWIQSRVGIKSRHWIDSQEDTATLGASAARLAIEKSNLHINDIDGIILATSTPLHRFPATATKIQSLLNMNHGFAFDIQAACCGFVYGLSICHAMIQSNQVRRLLYICSESMSQLLDSSDRSTAVIFADGAGALILENNTSYTSKGIIACSIHSNGDHYNQLYVKKEGGIYMEGKDIFKHATTKMLSSLQEVCDKGGVSISDLDWIIPHQANQRIIDYMIDKGNLNPEKVVSTIRYHGNTSAASIPLALDSISVKKGDLIGMVALGAGLTWGGCLIEY